MRNPSKAQPERRGCSEILFLLLFLLAFVQPASTLLTACFDPSGNLRQDKPCNPTAVQSACCDQGWVCTNTSLCVAGPTVQLNPGDPEQFEGSCTDKTWNSPLCPSFCRSGELSKNAANGVWNCTSGRYCCSAFSGDSQCCQRGTDVFFLGDYANITTIGGAVGSGFSTSTSASIQSSTSQATTMTSAVETPLPVTSTTLAGQTSQTSPSPTPVSTEPSGNGTPPLTTGATVGIAVGAVIVVAGLALLGFFLSRQRNNTNKLKAQMELLQHTPDTADSGLEGSVYEAKDQYYKDMPIQTAYEVEARHGTTEIAGYREVAEASAMREVSELPAETRRYP